MTMGNATRADAALRSATALAAAADDDEWIAALDAALRQLFDAHAWSVVLGGDNRATHRLAQSWGLDLAWREAVLTPGAEADASAVYPAVTDGTAEDDARAAALMRASLVCDGESLGYFVVARPAERPFGDDERSLAGGERLEVGGAGRVRGQPPRAADTARRDRAAPDGRCGRAATGALRRPPSG